MTGPIERHFRLAAEGTPTPAGEAQVGQQILWNDQWQRITAVEHEASKPSWILTPFAPEGAYVGITWTGRSTPEWFGAKEPIKVKTSR